MKMLFLYCYGQPKFLNFFKNKIFKFVKLSLKKKIFKEKSSKRYKRKIINLKCH